MTLVPDCSSYMGNGDMCRVLCQDQMRAVGFKTCIYTGSSGILVGSSICVTSEVEEVEPGVEPMALGGTYENQPALQTFDAVYSQFRMWINETTTSPALDVATVKAALALSLRVPVSDILFCELADTTPTRLAVYSDDAMTQTEAMLLMSAKLYDVAHIDSTSITWDTDPVTSIAFDFGAVKGNISDAMVKRLVAAELGLSNVSLILNVTITVVNITISNPAPPVLHTVSEVGSDLEVTSHRRLGDGLQFDPRREAAEHAARVDGRRLSGGRRLQEETVTGQYSEVTWQTAPGALLGPVKRYTLDFRYAYPENANFTTKRRYTVKFSLKGTELPIDGMITNPNSFEHTTLQAAGETHAVTGTRFHRALANQTLWIDSSLVHRLHAVAVLCFPSPRPSCRKSPASISWTASLTSSRTSLTRLEVVKSKVYEDSPAKRSFEVKYTSHHPYWYSCLRLRHRQEAVSFGP